MIIENTRMKCLFNPTEEEMIQREPLLRYSFFLSSKNNLLLNTIDTIKNKLDKGITKESINSDLVGDASILTWYWTLGAYEIVRTMTQTKDCFSIRLIQDLVVLKQKLAKVRIPNAKMEKRGKKEPVNSNRSFDGWDIQSKDLLIGDPNDYISARELFDLYDSTFSSIVVDDVVKKHEASIEYGKNE